MENEKTNNNDNSYRHILKYTGVFASVQMLSILVGVIRNKFTAIFLGPSGMGLLSLFNSTATFVSSATNLGIPTSGVKVISDSRTTNSKDTDLNGRELNASDSNGHTSIGHTSIGHTTNGSTTNGYTSGTSVSNCTTSNGSASNSSALNDAASNGSVLTSSASICSASNSSASNSSASNSSASNSSDVSVQIAESVALVRTFSLLSAFLGLLVCACLGPALNLFTFSWGNHTLHYVLLAPTVFFTILAGGETAVLKAMGQLRALATQASLLALFSLFVSVPIYWLFEQRGILAVLFLIAFCQWLLCLRYSRRVVHWSVNFSKMTLVRGIPLLRLGISFILAGMMNSGAEFLVRAFLNTQGDLEMVGLFNAGVTIVVVYAGIVFSVMESDYYPRLSSIVGERRSLEMVEQRRLTVNRQLEMNVLLIGPIVAVMILTLPIIIRILYSSEFSGMLLMTQMAAVGMLFKAIYLPIEYLPLSCGESKVFFVQESFCVILLVLCEIVGYMLSGLLGLGLGITLAYLVESLAVLIFSRLYYGYRLSRKAMGYIAFHFCMLLTIVLAAFYDGKSLFYLVSVGLLCVASIIFSLISIRKSLKN